MAEKTTINPFRHQRSGWNYFGQNPYAALAQSLPNDSYLGLYGEDTARASELQPQAISERGVETYDPATDRVKQAITNSFTDAAETGLTRAGVYGLASTVANRFSPDIAINMALSGFNPMSLATGMTRKTLAAALGLDTSSTFTQGSNVLAGALGMLAGNPALGVLGSVLSPVAAEGFGKLTGTRKDESLKSALEAAYGTNFLGAAKLRADVADMAKTPYESTSWKNPTVNSITGEAEEGLSPEGAAKNSRLFAAKNVEDAYTAQKEYQSELSKALKSDVSITPSYNPLSNYFDSTIESFGLTPGLNINTATDLADAIGFMRERDREVNPTGWSGNVNSSFNPTGISNALAARGLNISSLSSDQATDFAHAFNSASSFAQLGDAGKNLAAMRQQEAVNRAAAAVQAADAARAQAAAAARGGWGNPADAGNPGGWSTGGWGMNADGTVSGPGDSGRGPSGGTPGGSSSSGPSGGGDD